MLLPVQSASSSSPFHLRRPHTLLSGNWLSKLLLHCDKLSTGGSVAGRSPEGQTEAEEARRTSHLLGGTVCMMGGPWWPQLHSKPVESAAGTGSWHSSLHRLCPLDDGQTGAGAGRPSLDSTCTCCRSCPKYSARSSAGSFAGRGQRKVEAGRAVGDHVCWVSPQPQDC